MRKACLVLGAWCLVASAGAPIGLRAQTLLPPEPAFRAADFVPLLALGAAAALASPADKWLAQTVRRPAWVRTGFGHDVATVVSFIGGFAPFAATATTWAYGSQRHDLNARETAKTAAQAIVASSLVTGALKFAFGRARPYVSADSNPRDFKFGRGWRNDDYQSLPSGHATVAFAFAAAMSEERARIRGRSRGFDAAMYGSAALVALSRMALDKHWASDVLLGAGIGITSGLVTFRLAH